MMEYVQWKEILSAVNEEEDLSKDNVVEKIKEKVEDEDEYKKWENAGFSVNHLFQVAFYGRAEEHTLLHLAAEEGHTEIVDILIKAGANLDVVNDSKNTPLSQAANHNNTEMVNILMKAGTDLLLFDKNGYIRLLLEKKAVKN